jgi:adenine-specific DNA-methyltransferase
MPILDWLDREKDVKVADAVPYRLLEAVPDLSYGDVDSPNMLIQGDNLEALKALLPYYAGQVKCIFIDPPYNTRSAFEHYDDNLEHSKWLSTIYPRLELLQELLSEDGSIWVTIDDNEAHYLKVIMDEIFGRKNFVANVLWQKRTSPDARIQLGAAHDHILVYARDISKLSLSKLMLSDEQTKNYKNPDNDQKGAWTSTDFTAQGWRPNQMYKIISPSGVEYEPPPGRCWGNIESEYKRLLSEGRMWFGKDGKSRPRVKNYITEKEGISSWTWWPNSDVGHNQEAKKEINNLFGADNAFDTPKPERLIQRTLQIATNEGDLVLDSFLGSGTTAAVAHKLARRYIGVEMGEHAQTHCQPRLKKVVDGEQGGISEAVNWQGGGGFKFYRLSEPVFDAAGNINQSIRFAHLAAHVWFSENRVALTKPAKSPLLGVHNDTAYYLLFNGILGDKRPDGGNVLTSKMLRDLPPHDGTKIIYGESTRLSPARLKAENIVFKQTPYDVKAR